MPLKDDINFALAELGQAPNLPDMTLNESGLCRIPVPILPALIKLQAGQLPIDVQLSHTGKFFSLITPLAIIKDQSTPAFLEALLYRQFYADQVSGAGFAISVTDDYDQLVAICHWMLDAITPKEFKRFYQKFIVAAFDLIDEINEMAPNTSNVHPIHEGRA